jgi:hypothetical protein
MSTLLGDVTLEHVQRIEHELDGGFVTTRLAGLEGELQQRTGRPSHRIHVAGVAVGQDAASILQQLQQKARSGEELDFAANITTALELQKVVIRHFRAAESAGHPQRFDYELHLAESPPLPPPAELESFGGLGDFGLGDLGFDTDILGDLQDIAGDVADAVSGAMDVLDQLGALAALASGDGLQLGNFMEPLTSAVDKVPDVGRQLSGAASALTKVFGT